MSVKNCDIQLACSMHQLIVHWQHRPRARGDLLKFCALVCNVTLALEWTLYLQWAWSWSHDVFDICPVEWNNCQWPWVSVRVTLKLFETFVSYVYSVVVDFACDSIMCSISMSWNICFIQVIILMYSIYCSYIYTLCFKKQTPIIFSNNFYKNLSVNIKNFWHR